MFTGIITDIGTIRKAEQRGDLRLEIACHYDMATVDLGASIACSGACLTVVDKGVDEGGEGWFAVDLSAETVARTAQGQWNEGARLNLERALKVGDELGGHIVTGHVDGIGEIISAEPKGDSTVITIRAPAELAPYIAAKGSIALDGVSLTVNDVADKGGTTEFTINLIPHTAEMTTFDQVVSGRPVNIEIDILARYLGRMKHAITA
jgi:riboflavin synthase